MTSLIFSENKNNNNKTTTTTKQKQKKNNNKLRMSSSAYMLGGFKGFMFFKIAKKYIWKKNAVHFGLCKITGIAK